ncbi:MAG: LysE family translocator [Pseudomonadota bacterium]
MPSWETIVLVTLAGLALSASPGPSMLYVLSRSIGQSRAAGLASAVGLATGGLLLALAAALGLTAVFQHSETLYLTVQYAGAAYLVYLGVRMLIPEGESEDTLEDVRHESVGKIVFQGIFVELLNPKTILFFLAFIPQFIQPNGNVPLQMLVLGVLVPLTALPSDVIVSFAGGTLAERLSQNRKVGVALNWLGGLFLVGLGVRTFFL